MRLLLCVQTNWIWNVQAILACIRYWKRLETNMDYVTGKYRFVLIYLMTLCKLRTLPSAQREGNFEWLLCYEFWLIKYDKAIKSKKWREVKWGEVGYKYE